MGSDITKPLQKVVRAFHPLEDAIKPITNPLKKILNKTGPIGVRRGAPPSSAQPNRISDQMMPQRGSSQVPVAGPFTCSPAHMIVSSVAIVQSMITPERKQHVGVDSKLSDLQVAALAPIYQWSDGPDARRAVLSFDGTNPPGTGWWTNGQPVGWVFTRQVPRSIGVKRWRSPDNRIIIYTAGLITSQKTRQRLALGATVDDGIVFYITNLLSVGKFINWASHGMPPIRMFSPT